MRVKVYRVDVERNRIERDRVILHVTVEMFQRARDAAHVGREVDDEGSMLADLCDDGGNILDVLVYTRQMHDRVVAELCQRP